MRKWIIDRLWLPSMTDEIVIKWLRESTLEIIRNKFRQERVDCHVRKNRTKAAQRPMEPSQMIITGDDPPKDFSIKNGTVVGGGTKDRVDTIGNTLPSEEGY